MSKRTTPSPRFWTVLGVINVLVMVYPISLSVGDGNDGWFAAIVLICAIFLLIMTDIVSVLVAFSLFEY